MALHFTEMRFASLLSGEVTTLTVINPPKKALANRTSLHFMASKVTVLKKTRQHLLR